jgi:hypothetical protein
MRIACVAIVSFAILLLCGCNPQKTLPASDLFLPNPGYLWTLSDSGNPAEVFLIDTHARIRLVCKLSKVNNRDWEDIALGAGPEAGKNYVYVADIGDNSARYEVKFIYRFPEPLLADVKDRIITQFDTLTLRMPDGKRDAETLMIDPSTHDLFLISKRESAVHVYQVHYPFGRGIIVPDKICEIPFSLIVGGSISADGREVLLKDYVRIYYWKKSVHEKLQDMFSRKPIELPYDPEPQGEGIAWALDSTGFYTVSESPHGQQGQLKFYQRK